jgi:Putative prokaryotic signal transducing protein
MANDYKLAARCLDPTQAHVLQGCLRAAGIAAAVTDNHHVQMNFLWAIALGGARVLVPAHQLAVAREVLAAFERGDLALQDGEVPD